MMMVNREQIGFIPEEKGGDIAGKLVVVIESEAEGAIADCLSLISAMPGVLSASLVYHEISEDQEISGPFTPVRSDPSSGEPS